MTAYKVRFHTSIEVTVSINADDEDAAAEYAWQTAEDYLQTIYGNYRDVHASASLDGVGADEVEPS